MNDIKAKMLSKIDKILDREDLSIMELQTLSFIIRDMSLKDPVEPLLSVYNNLLTVEKEKSDALQKDN